MKWGEAAVREALKEIFDEERSYLKLHALEDDDVAIAHLDQLKKDVLAVLALREKELREKRQYYLDIESIGTDFIAEIYEEILGV